MAWVCAVAPLRRLFEAAIRDGIRPPTTFDGLPPGEFPPIEAIKDEWFGRPARAADAPFDSGVAPGARIRTGDDKGAAR